MVFIDKHNINKRKQFRYTSMHASMQTHMHACMHACMHAHTHVHTHAYVHRSHQITTSKLNTNHLAHTEQVDDIILFYVHPQDIARNLSRVLIRVL